MSVKAWVPCDHEFVCGLLGVWLLLFACSGAETLAGRVLIAIGAPLIIFALTSWCSRAVHRELLADAEHLRVHPVLGEPVGMLPLEWLAIALASSLAISALVSRWWPIFALVVFTLAFVWGELLGRRIEIRSERMRRFYGNGACARNQVLVPALFTRDPLDRR